VPGGERLKLLTDSIHYVQTGDWVAMQLRDAAARHDAVLFSFALGELSHYAVDRMGHYYGTNVVAVVVARKQDVFGARMSYEEDEATHFVVEFSFDYLALLHRCSPDEIEEVARYLPQGRTWEMAGRVVEFLNAEYQKMFFGTRLELKEEYFVQALLIADDLFARTAFGAERVGRRPGSTLPGLIDNLEDNLKIQKLSEAIDWVSERVQAGMKLGQTYEESKIATFDGSYQRANELYASVLKEVAQAAARMDWETLKFENINLDTDVTSVSGEYDLADTTYEHILSHQQGDQKIACPPHGTRFDDYFKRGQWRRQFLSGRAADLEPGPRLEASLEKISEFFTDEHRKTQNTPIPTADLRSVHFTKCASLGDCIRQSGATLFPQVKNVGVAPGMVNYVARSRLLAVWQAATAASLMKAGGIAGDETKTLQDAKERSLTILDVYRLPDLRSARGYYSSVDFCLAAPKASVPQLSLKH